MPAPVPCFLETKRLGEAALKAAYHHVELGVAYSRSPTASLQRTHKGAAAEVERIRQSVGRHCSPHTPADLAKVEKAAAEASAAYELQAGLDFHLSGEIAKASTLRCNKIDAGWKAYEIESQPTVEALQGEINGLTAELVSALRTLAIVRGDHVGSASALQLLDGRRILIATAPILSTHLPVVEAVQAVRAVLELAESDDPTLRKVA